MSRVVSIVIVILAVAAGLYQLYIKPILTKGGIWREIEPRANKNCTAVPELQACEKIVLHDPSGILYLACSTPSSRTVWTPSADLFDSERASFNDYVATYDHNTGKVTRLKFVNFESERGFSAHGMDVVQSSSNPTELFVYLINHRAPINQSAREVGADTSVEIFKTAVGSDTLTHMHTVEDPQVVVCPNDVVGYPDGQSFYFTNDHSVRVGLFRSLELFRSASSVGYCHVQNGCKLAITKMGSPNGIARAENDTIYVASIPGAISFFERQSDNTLVLTDTVWADRVLDNISVDSEGVLWVAGFPNIFTWLKHFSNPSMPAPSSGLQILLNTGKSSFYGEKYQVNKAFEDDGHVASGATSVVHDAQRRRLFLHGVTALQLSICQI